MPVALITGVAGQDGSYLAEALLARGTEVHGLVRPGSDRVPPAGVKAHEVDLLDGAGLTRLVERVEPDAVYNLGGVTSVARSWREPALTAAVTGLGAVHLLAAAQRLEDAGRSVRFLQASSSEMFGDAADQPQTEETVLRPVSPYGAAKVFAHLATAVQRGRGLFASTVILYGHESPRRPLDFVARRISAGVAAIVRGEASVLTLGNLDARRDWGWAPDFVDAMLRVLEAQQAGDYVVSTGRTHTVAEFVAAAFAAVGIEDWQAYVRTDPTLLRPADQAVQVGDASRLRSLGWRPTRGFDEVVASMVEADLVRR